MISYSSVPVVEDMLLSVMTENTLEMVYRFRLSIFAGAVGVLAVLFSALRVFLTVWLGEKKGSLLRTRPTGVTNEDAVKYVNICVVVVAVFCYIADPVASHPLAKGTPGYLAPEDRLDAVEYRFTNWVIGTLACIAIYKAALPITKKFITADQANAQAANVVRIAMKVSLGVWFFGINFGNILTIISSKPGVLPEVHFRNEQITIQGMSILYVWELMFRELKPVNVAHHAYTIASCWAILEWVPVDQPVRQLAVIPIAGSLIESVCCMGTMCYRFMAPSRRLSKILTGEGYFVIIAYNLLAVSFFTLMYAFRAYFSWIICISMSGVYLFTYPAQMNMAKMFFALSRKTRAAHKAVQEQRQAMHNAAALAAKVDPEAVVSYPRRRVPQHVR